MDHTLAKCQSTMGKFTLVLTFSLLCPTLLVIAISFNNISCYRYAIASGIGSESIDEFYTLNGSCNAEKEPRSHLIVNCREWYKSSSNKSFHLYEDTRVTFSCIKRTYDGWLERSGRKAKVTLRSCIGLFDSHEPLPDGCYRYRSSVPTSKIGDDEEDVIKEFDADTKIDVCICNTNECNGARRSICIDTIVVFGIMLNVGIKHFVN